MNVRIGISGWRYPPWRGVFYPKGLSQHRELFHASRKLSSIELNGSFYSLQRPASYLEWYHDTPPDFVFAVKANRYITHIRRLRDIAQPLANFFASGLFNLREKLGPILWQFPPTMQFDPEIFESFLGHLPYNTAGALHLARRRQPMMHGRSRLAIDRNRPLRHAVEIRHKSFINPAFPALLRRHNVALVVADTAGKWPYCEDITADFMYLRLHGDKKLYASGYSNVALDRWAARIRTWQSGGEPRDAQRIAGKARPARRRDIYCYFDNDIKVCAPFDAARLSMRLSTG